MPTFVASVSGRADRGDPHRACAPARGPARGIGWAIALLSISVACRRADARPSAPPAPPSELLVSVAVGPVTTLRNLGAYIEKISPGASTGLTDQAVRRELAGLVGASSLDGFDPTRWTYVLIASIGDAPGFALVGKVDDARTLATSAGSAATMIKGGWAAIGPRPVLERVGTYALTTIASQPAPKAPSATVYLAHVMARYRTAIEAVRGQLVASLAAPNGGAVNQLLTAYLDGLASLAADTDQLTVTLEATPDTATFDLALTPKPNSRLAKFVALQRPTDYALLEQLPTLSPMMLLGGHLESGPYRDGVFALMSSIYGPSASPELLAGMEALRKAMTGDIAMAVQLAPGAGFSVTQLFGLTDTAAASRAVAAMLDLFKTARTFDALGVPTTIHASPDATIYEGVALRSYESSVDLAKLGAAQRKTLAAALPDGKSRAYIATFDGFGIVVASKDSLSDAKRAIDARRGKPTRAPLEPGLRALFAASRTRQDSLAAVLDMASYISTLTGAPGGSGLPVMMSLGCADRRAHLGLALPAATLQALANVNKP